MAVPDPRRGTSLITALIGALLVAGACKQEPDPIDPDDAYVQPGDHVVAIHVRPDRLVLDTDTTFEMVCVGLTDDGYLATLHDCDFELAGGDAVQVGTDGLLTPAGTGAAQVLARRGTLASSLADVEVVAPGTVDLRVTDPDGVPMKNTEVRIGTPTALATGTTDGAGRVHLEGDFSGPIDVVVFPPDPFRKTILLGARPRNLALAVGPEQRERPLARAVGTVEFPEEPEPGVMALAVALTSTPVGPAFTTVNDFMPGNRVISDFGMDVSLPYNLVIKNIVEEFYAPIYSGEAVLMVAGGYFDLSEVLIVAQQLQEEGIGSMFNIIGVYADRLMVGLEGPLDVPIEGFGPNVYVEDLEVSMDIPLDREVMVTLLSPPAEFWTTDPPTVLAYRELEQELGWAVVGVGVGKKPYSDPDTDPPETDDDDDDDDATGTVWALPPMKPWETVPVLEAAAGHPLGTPYTIYGAMSVYAGVGPGHPNATLAFSPPMTGTDVVLPPFYPLTEVHGYDEPLGSFAYTTPPDVDVGRGSVFYREVTPRDAAIGEQADLVDWLIVDVFHDGGETAFQLPADVIDYQPPPTQALAEVENSLTVDAVGMRATNYQAMITDDGLEGTEVFQTWANRRSVVAVEWWSDATAEE